MKYPRQGLNNSRLPSEIPQIDAAVSILVSNCPREVAFLAGMPADEIKAALVEAVKWAEG